MTIRIGLLGGRGYVGQHLLALLVRHPGFELAWAASRSRAGVVLSEEHPQLELPPLVFQPPEPDRLASLGAEVVVLALGNGEAAPWVSALHSVKRFLDISADYRFDPHWIYGLPEHRRGDIFGAERVSNPGCYATGAQLGLQPLLGLGLQQATVFGVSGYSGAGRTPSERNDPERLRDNLIPYSLCGHVHENEMTYHLGHQVRFLPHVAAFFRGISLTIAAKLAEVSSVAALCEHYHKVYGQEPLIELTKAIPEVVQVRDTPKVRIGGFSVDERDQRRIALVVCLDNLLKGAASQALQNLNLMCGYEEMTGVLHG